MRCGALTRAARTAITMRNSERHAIPASLSRGETAAADTTASGSHRKRMHGGRFAPIVGDLRLHRTQLSACRGRHLPSVNGKSLRGAYSKAQVR